MSKSNSKRLKSGSSSGWLIHPPKLIRKVLHTPGQSLNSTTIDAMESHFGHNFSRVRVHTDAEAAKSAETLNASAYTVGSDVVFARGQYSPGTIKGQSLLAHELTHVLQQRNLESIPPGQELDIASDNDPTEKEARAYAKDQSPGEGGNNIRSQLSTPTLQRVSLWENIKRFFGGGTFSEKELQDYLRYLDEYQQIENLFESDNKAREVVKRWKRGHSLYILPVRRKILLIEEMLSGFTGDDDEQAILDLLRGSTDTEFSTILGAIGLSKLNLAFHGEEQKQLDRLVAARKPKKDRKKQPEPESPEVIPGETALLLQKRFTSNSESMNRANCIVIIRELAPTIFSGDPQLAERVKKELGKLKDKELKMTEVGRVLSDLGLASNHAEIPFDNGNGIREPKTMQGSAWDTIIGMLGSVQGWHVFGMAVFSGWHSVTVLVDNRPDEPHVYWADQWRIDPGEDFYQGPGSVSGFRRYEKEGFDRFINEKTNEWWNFVHSPESKCGKLHPKNWDSKCRWNASLHIWKFRFRKPVSGSP
jgi:hypothetical protein